MNSARHPTPFWTPDKRARFKDHLRALDARAEVPPYQANPERFAEQMEVFERMRQTDAEFRALAGCRVEVKREASVPLNEVHVVVDGVVTKLCIGR